jgi:hypothetical protein
MIRKKEKSRQMLHRRLASAPARGRLPASRAGFLMRSAAVPAVVGLPHGLSRSLVFRVFVAVVLIVFVVFRWTQHDLAGAATVRKRQRLQDIRRLIGAGTRRRSRSGRPLGVQARRPLLVARLSRRFCSDA